MISLMGARIMLNIVIPMAGYGSRFVSAGFVEPKPMIKVHGKPMIQLVVENLRPKKPHRFIFICREEHLRVYDLKSFLLDIAPDSLIISIKEVTEGAACTVLLSKKLINNDQQLMIANCDQFIDVDINEYLARMDNPKIDGMIMTMRASDCKWSYIKYNKMNLVEFVVEKQVISDEATVGIYNFRNGSDFVGSAEAMIQMNMRVNNEFYVAPTYNHLIAEGKSIAFFNVGSSGCGMYGLGTPEDLDWFECHM